MRLYQVLPLATAGAAFVLPDEQILARLPEPQSRLSSIREDAKSFLHKLPCPHHILDSARSSLRNALDHAVESVEQVLDTGARKFTPGFDAEAWLEGANFEVDEEINTFEGPAHPAPPFDHPPHGPPPFPHDGPPSPHGPPPHHGPPSHDGQASSHRPKGSKYGHHKSNKTIYELISESKYTTKLAELVSEYPDIFAALNSTKANFTLFAPTDHAFAKIPKHGSKPPKEFIEKVLLYHVTPHVYPAGRLLFSHTVPTLLNSTQLGDRPQRLVAKVGLRGVTINYYSRVVAVNIPATNGIIHGVDSLLIPPPKALKIISLLPSEFSTLLLALEKTGLTSVLASAPTTGGTLFAPPNRAFKKLGPAINAFLFSKRGEKFLKALLTYHVVANETLYSNTYYGPSEAQMRMKSEKEVGADTVPIFHYDLPTLLEGKSLSVDKARYGPFISIKINGFVRVVVADGVAKDGVLHVVSDVLVPPRRGAGLEAQEWRGEELSVEELVERLEPYVLEEQTWEL